MRDMAPVVLSLGPQFSAAWSSLFITKGFCVPHCCAVEGKASKGKLGELVDRYLQS